MTRSAVLLTVLIFLICASGVSSAQQGDISANVIGAYSTDVTSKGLHETATKSGGALISFRYFPHQHNGVEVNYAYTKNSHILTDLSGNSVSRVQAGIHELTGAYVFHVNRGRLQPFALAGGGILMFHPTDDAIKATNLSLNRQTRPTFLYGAGLDIRITKSLAARAQYRALLFESPDFYGDGLALHTSTAMQMGEPTIGIVYRF